MTTNSTADTSAVIQADETLLAIAKFVDDFRAPWGSWKTAWWEGEVSDDAAFTPDNALMHIANMARRSAVRLSHADQPVGWRERLTRIRTSMVVLQQHAEGCAANHYGGDFALFGMPGWLVDTKADLDAFTDLLSAAPVSPAVGGDVEKYADMDIDDRAAAMADDGVGNPWELLGYFREKLRQSQTACEGARDAAVGYAQRLAAVGANK